MRTAGDNIITAEASKERSTNGSTSWIRKPAASWRTEGDDHGGAASRKRSGAAEAGYWQDFFDERAAHREFDGGHSRADAERLAFGEMILEWHRRYGARPGPLRCAVRGDELPSKGGLALCDGARVHFDAVRRVDCIITYGQKWRGAAAAGLRELGFDPPQGFELWS